MIFDYTAGGSIQTPSKQDTFLAVYKTNANSTPSSERVKSKEDALARWRKDGGPIGKAIRDGKIELLRLAINEVRKRRSR